MSGLPVRGIGKSWRGQPCAYCDERQAQGVDHIFARGFFPKERRGNLPQAPACEVCADRKSKLETALTGTLPFAASHDDASNLLALSPNKVKNNKRLRKTLEEQGALVAAQGDIDLRSALDLNFDADPIVPLFELIVRGLYFHHWRMRLDPGFGARARAFPRGKAAPALDLFKLNVGAAVAQDIGGGAFLYEGIRTADNPSASLWRFRILGGITFRHRDGEQEELDEFIVATLRDEFWEKIAAE